MTDPEKGFERFIRLFFGVLGVVVIVVGLVMFAGTSQTAFPLMLGFLSGFQILFGGSALAVSIFWPRVIAWLDRP